MASLGSMIISSSGNNLVVTYNATFDQAYPAHKVMAFGKINYYM
jgi:hypothetical protein